MTAQDQTRAAVIAIAENDRLLADLIETAVEVLRGPDEDLREEELELLTSTVQRIRGSASYLMEYVQ